MVEKSKQKERQNPAATDLSNSPPTGIILDIEDFEAASQTADKLEGVLDAAIKLAHSRDSHCTVLRLLAVAYGQSNDIKRAIALHKKI